MSDKTNAIRILEQFNISHKTLRYEVKDGLVDGISVANKIGMSVDEVYKTLVTQGASGRYYVFLIPVYSELDLKKAAKVADEKYIEMIHVKDMMTLTGYVKGGCSPIGMKKHFKTYIEEEAMLFEAIVASAGKVGLQMCLDPSHLKELIQAEWADLKKE